MTNSILQFIFPLTEYISKQGNINKKSNETLKSIDNLTMHKSLFSGIDEANIVSEHWPTYESQVTSFKAGGIFSMLVSSQIPKIETVHQRNLLFQCALTIASKKIYDISTASKDRQTVTIITPQRWDNLPNNFVCEMEITSDAIEQVMMSNRIKFVYPKTYEELIIYLAALSGNNERKGNVFILEDMEYYLNTNEKTYIQEEEISKDALDLNNTSIYTHQTTEAKNVKYLQRLTKLMAIIRNILSFENRQNQTTTLTNAEQAINVPKFPICRFVVNLSSSADHTLSPPELLKLYMWIDEVWILSSENSNTIADDHEIPRTSLSKIKRLNMSFALINQNTLHSKCNFYYDERKKCYLFKSIDVV